MVKLMFEYDPQNIYKIPISLGKTEHVDFRSQDQDRKRISEIVEKYQTVPNRVGVIAYIDNPSEEHPHTPTRLGGVDAEIITGKKTRFESFHTDGNTVGGSVTIVDGKQKVNNGKVILTLEISDGKETRKENEVIDLDDQGTFHHRLKEDKNGELVLVQGYYLPGPGLGDCYSEINRVGSDG
jgi:hypothetical protein